MQCQTYVTFFPWLGNSNFCISLKKNAILHLFVFCDVMSFFHADFFKCLFSQCIKKNTQKRNEDIKHRKKNRDAREVTNQTDNNHIGTTKRKTSRKLWKLSNKNKKKKIL